MKVCTDACLFGAWLANTINTNEFKSMLDIGTGTGLLSLMLAQKSSAEIHALEIDEDAANQAAENFAASPWSIRLQVIEQPVQMFQPHKKYDLIFSNPPFFENDLKSPDQQRNKALHSTYLSSEALILSIKKLLNPEGKFALLLPAHRSEHYEQLAQKAGFTLQQKVNVCQTEKHPFFRAMLLYGPAQHLIESEITIKEGGDYSTAFVQLLKDYYLYF